MTDEELKEQFENTWRRFDELRLDVHTEVADVKRHMDVVTEGLKKEIQLIPEDVDNLDQKFTREFVLVREEMKEGFAETRALIDSSYGQLDRRVSALERRKR